MSFGAFLCNGFLAADLALKGKRRMDASGRVLTITGHHEPYVVRRSVGYDCRREDDYGHENCRVQGGTLYGDRYEWQCICGCHGTRQRRPLWVMNSAEWVEGVDFVIEEESHDKSEL